MKAIVNVERLEVIIPQGIFDLADGLNFEEARLEGRLFSTKGQFQYAWNLSQNLEEIKEDFFPRGFQPRTGGITLYNVEIGINRVPSKRFHIEVRRGHDVMSRFADGTPRLRFSAFIGFDDLSSSRHDRLEALKAGLASICYYPPDEASPMVLTMENFPVGAMLSTEGSIRETQFSGQNTRRIGRLLFTGDPFANISGFAADDFVCFSLEAYKGPYSVLDSKTNQIWTTDWSGGNYIIRLPRS